MAIHCLPLSPIGKKEPTNNQAQAMGFKVLRFTPDQLLSPKAKRIINQAIQHLSQSDT